MANSSIVAVDPSHPWKQSLQNSEIVDAGTSGLPLVSQGTGAAPAYTKLAAAALADAVADALWKVVVTAGAEAGNKIILSVQVKDLQGNNLAVATPLVLKPVSAVDASYAVSDDGAGTALGSSADKVSTITTDATGLAEIGITDTAAETIVLAFETPQGPVLASLVFA